ncbi:FUSC family protein [Lacinutrix sp. C3R15]|uniref:FUSC family protein n=1 Tax=Flavobacteriaceae TaxID=49546 RepID=UPI001C082BC8|nr:MULTISPECIES: FUSC family protein [Flavobacteriaceae]MBU2940565.1 FUSC family protein [Lacinutrix sp. C3R15]MDO6623884.1 FUSC family protein [Oceanihabitans sp. 1_MG-2023]
MRKLFITLGIITAVIAVILSALPLFNVAIIPAIAALVFGFIAFYLSKKEKQSKKAVQLIFLLTIVSLCLTTYKSIFNKTEVGDTEALELRVQEAEDNAIEELEGLDLSE